MEISAKYTIECKKKIQRTMLMMMIPTVKKKNKEYLHANPSFKLFLQGYIKKFLIITFREKHLG